MFTIASTPAKQSVSETITTLSCRLSSSTLLEDRRAAILGLRSFAKEFPASVASNALRVLIDSLRKDGEDVDTVKLVMETLLMLSNPNASSPEASEEISLWLADEFTQRQDNITLLLQFLDKSDFYSLLYTLQLLSTILKSRNDRTEECIFTAPLGISRLVAVLDDRRDAIRNEGLSLLTYLTPRSAELQKLVAFENAFDRVFNIIKLDGSLSRGGRVVEDSLILLANLLRLNHSNQAYFRETGCVPKLTQLLHDAHSCQDKEAQFADWAKAQENRNLYALLAVLRLFLVPAGLGTPVNQFSFWQHGILGQVLTLAFARSTELSIKTEALITCADLIRGNSGLQEGFAQLQVTSVLDEPTDEVLGSARQGAIPKVYVIDGLLDLTLSVPQTSAFDTRLAACECIKAYFFEHSVIRKHFLRRAIDGHNSGSDETANILTTLLNPLHSDEFGDPYRFWFAAVLLFHLIFEDSDAKGLVRSVTEGNASEGEDVVTCIQAITGNLIASFHIHLDERAQVACLMLLCGWLFEDPDAVNDFLGEGSNVQNLANIIASHGAASDLVRGLCTLLLGIVYEFSTKDSPIPRATLHALLASRIGRDQYVDRLTSLRRHPSLRDFEVLPQSLSSSAAGALPEVFFDSTFVEFAKDNFSRLLRAIDRDPGLEVPVLTNGILKGISREMVDSLRTQLEEMTKALQKSQEDLLTLTRQLEQEKVDHRKARETALLEISRIKSANESLKAHHEKDLSTVQLEKLSMAQRFQTQLEETCRAADLNIRSTRQAAEDQISDLKIQLRTLESTLMKAHNDHIQDLETADREHMAKVAAQVVRLERAREDVADLETRIVSSASHLLTAEEALSQSIVEREAVQCELEDLLLVLADVEERANRYKKRLQALGETVSDGEDDDEAHVQVD